MSRSNSWGGDVLAVAIVCFLLMFVGGVAAVGTLFWWGPTEAERKRARDSYRIEEKMPYSYDSYKDGAYDYGYEEKMEAYPDEGYPKGYDEPDYSKDGFKDF